MRIRAAVAAAALALTGLSAGLVAAPADALAPAVAKHACTKTSSGTCIKGGQFCPQASYGKIGWDAKGHKWRCKGDHVHPHWMKP